MTAAEADVDWSKLDDSDELFSDYVKKAFAIPKPNPHGPMHAPRQSRLKGNNLVVYNKAKDLITKVANGTSTTSETTIPFSELQSVKTSYTYAELGLTSASSADDIGNAIRAAVIQNINVDSRLVRDALLADLPYDFYWFDKVTGSNIGPTCSFSYNGKTITLTSGEEYVGFPVSTNYSVDGREKTFDVDAQKIPRVQTAVNNARAIVQDVETQNLSDDQVLEVFKNAVCSRVSYNETAAHNASTPYGDPWQLISVFDDDPNDDTKVVCEGYSKAFKYLCDLYKADGKFHDTSLDVYLVSGTLTGSDGKSGDHMWNVVQKSDGVYLADVTNSDDGTAGDDGSLFMTVPEAYDSMDNSYAIQHSWGKTGYQYDHDILTDFDLAEIKPEKIEVTPSTAEINLNGTNKTVQLTAKFTPSEGQAVTWESSNPSAATVDTNGLVTAVGEGRAVITATKSGESKKSSCKVKVTNTNVEVTEIKLTPNPVDMTVGDTSTITASVRPYKATNRNVTWKSSDTNVATVDAAADNTGKVTAVGAGEATITATSVSNPNVTAACTVKVSASKVSVTSIKLSETSKTVTEGDSPFTLTATVEPDKATEKGVNWSSSEPTVAKVESIGDSTSKVTIVGPGTATITATSADDSNIKATCELTVNPKPVSVTGVTLNKNALSLAVGDSETLTAKVTPDNAPNTNVTWSVEPSGIVSVDQNGKITAHQKGTATVTVASEGDPTKKATCTVTVTGKPVTGVRLDKKTAEVNVGGTVTLIATVEPADAENRNVTWSSSDPDVATVENGVVTGVKAGTAVITVTTAEGNKTVECTVNVKTVPVTGITLSNSALNLTAGQSQTLKATITPGTATEKTLQWTSNNEGVATVVNGKVTAVAAGSATITASATDGSNVFASCTVTVAAAPKKITNISINGNNELTVGDKGTFTAAITPLDADEASLKWSSDNPTILEVSEDGTYTAVSDGKATVTATAQDDSGASASKQITVNKKEIKVSSITITPPDHDLEVNEEAQLAYRVVPENPTNKSLKWTSSDNTIVSVNQTGKVTAHKSGTATITAAAADGSNVKGTCEITVKKNTPQEPVNIPVTGVSFNTTSIETPLDTSETIHLKDWLSFTPETATNKNVSWTSSDSNVATVDQDGDVTMLKPGNVTITATTQDGGHTASCELVIKEPEPPKPQATKITVSAPEGKTELTVGDKVQLSAAVEPEDADKSVYWYVDNQDTATISDEGGLLTAKAAGTVTVTAASNDGRGITGSITLTIKAKEEPKPEPKKVTGITIDTKVNALTVGDSTTLAITVQPSDANNKSITWSSSDEKVATVKDGTVKAIGAGTAVITVKANDGSGKSASVTITVKEKAVVTPKPEPETTPAPTPETTPAPTPETTPAPTPETTPAPKPETTPAPAPSQPDTPRASWRPASASGTQDVQQTTPEAGSRTRQTSVFADVPSSSYVYKPAVWAARHGIASGYADGNFHPNDPCTRTQMAMFLYRLVGSPSVTGSLPFTDVAKGSASYDVILWAYQQGIASGTSGALFSPNKACTRGEMAAFLYRMAKSPAVRGNSGFADVSADAYYAKAAAYLKQAGITSGISADLFMPGQTCTRGQMVSFLYRYAGNK